MTDGNGSQELVRIATAYLASIGFCITFLVATMYGASGMTALLRGAIVAGAATFGGPLLLSPVVDVVLTAMARDEAKRQAKPTKEEEV